MEWSQSGRKTIWLLPSGRCSGDTDFGWWASWRMTEAPKSLFIVLFAVHLGLKEEAHLLAVMCSSLKDFVHFV